MVKFRENVYLLKNTRKMHFVRVQVNMFDDYVSGSMVVIIEVYLAGIKVCIFKRYLY